jgi:hypothetical protein
MRIEFLSGDCPGRQETQDHIRSVYKAVYSAKINEFAPLLVAARRANGEILCAAGIRTSRDQFFSDNYLDAAFSTVLRAKTSIDAPQSEIMEVVSLASTTPFPVLPMMDAIIGWGRANGMTCGVFTATRSLRRLLKRTGLPYVEVAAADVSKIADPTIWGTYYDTDPWVCAFSEAPTELLTLSPRSRAAELRSEAS